MKIATPFDDVQEITGRRTRLPDALLYSRRHSAAATVIYGLVDIVSDDNWGPAEFGRRWLAQRLDLAVSTIDDAVGALSRPHEGRNATEPDLPVFLLSKQRGKSQTAVRRVVAGVPFVEVPEWTLGDQIRGMPVDAKAWRLYAALLKNRLPGLGVVLLKNREIAALLHIKVDSVTELVRSLEAARLVVRLERPGQSTALLPVTVQISAEQVDELRDRVATAVDYQPKTCGQAVDNAVDSCGQIVEDEDEACGELAEPTPLHRNAPTPHDRNAPTPHFRNAYKRDPIYEDPIYVDPAVGCAAPPERAPDEKPLTSVAAIAASAAAVSLLTLVQSQPKWCGRCPGPNRRIDTHPDTGLPTGKPCPRCGSTKAGTRAA